MHQRRNEVLPFAKLRDVQDGEPQPERKCEACMGDGVLPVIDVKGDVRCVAPCPICGGTGYAP